MSGKEDKLIEVTGNYNVNPGDSVIIMMKQSMGYNAILLSYILPLVAVFVILIILVSYSVSELAAGIFSLAILIPYYFLLYLFRNKIDKKFTFTLKP